MKIISEFNSLQEMNQYYCNSFSFDDSITFLGNSSLHSDLLLSLSEKVIQTVKNSQSSFYIYQFSKTSFRKNIHPSLTNSIYKAFINSLKNNSYIIELSGSNVILKPDDLTQEVYDSFLSQISFDNFDSLDFLSKLSTKISNLEADIVFYQNHISLLQDICQNLQDQVSQTSQALYDKSISTWC